MDIVVLEALRLCTAISRVVTAGGGPTHRLIPVPLAVPTRVAAGFDRDNVWLQPGASDDVIRTERNQDPDVIYRGYMTPDRGLSAGFVLGFLGGGLFGLILGSGGLELMGKEPAMAAGPFWSAVIGAVVLGLSGALAGHIFNSPLPKPEPPEGDDHLRMSYPTIVSVSAAGDDLQRARLARLRAQVEFARKRGTDAPAMLLEAAQRLEPLDAALARETYLDAFAATLFSGRLGDPTSLHAVAEAALAAPAGSGL